MRATGIVRRIDDLGRVVIPKEIRRTLKIREGDPLEIYTNNGGEVIFKKIFSLGEMTTFAEQYAEVLNRISKAPVIITDRDQVVAVSGISKKNITAVPYQIHSISLWNKERLIPQTKTISVALRLFRELTVLQQ